MLSIKKALQKKEGKVKVRGWVWQCRKLKDKIFIVLRDSSGLIQCVVHKDKVSKELWEKANKITIESAIVVEGNLKEDRRAITGYEIHIKNLEILHIAEPFPIPVRKQYHSKELLLDYRHLWLRSPEMINILKIRSTVFFAIHKFFRKKGFYEFHAPIITSGAAESGPTKFKIDYFGKTLYLTQTWQFYAEAAIFALEKICTIAPCFRAEKSKTSRHLTEFWHAEVEACWYDLKKIMNLAEELVKFVIKSVLKENEKELKTLRNDLEPLKKALEKRWPRITYDQALKLLKEKQNLVVKWGKDLRTIEEKKLMELFDTPIFVTHYPKEIMAFYKPRDKKRPETARCFDLIAPEGYGELAGGSERDLSIEELVKALKKAGEKIEHYKFYLDTRRYGSVPHSGFGLGVERLISWICKLEHIRDAIAFPRTMTRYLP